MTAPNRNQNPAGRGSPDADIRQGTQRDAILFSLSANAQHGQRRTNEDKRRAVLVLLNDGEWCRWSNSEIARRAGVDEKTVRNIRMPAEPCASSEFPKIPETRTVQRGGTVYEQRTGNIGHSRPAAPPPPPPPARPAPAWTMADIATDSDDPPLPFSETDPEPTRGRHFPRGRLAQPWKFQGSTPNPVR